MTFDFLNSPLIKTLRSNTNCCLAVGFNLQARIAGPKGRRPSDVQQCGAAADQGAEGDAGPSEQRAAKRSADECSEAEAPKKRSAPKEALTSINWDQRKRFI